MTTSELDGIVWRTSSYSASNGACVEIAPVRSGFAVRDSKHPTGPTLAFDRDQWQGFLAALPTR